MTLWGEGEEKAGVKQSQVGQEEEDCRDQINKNTWWISEPELSFLVSYVKRA